MNGGEKNFYHLALGIGSQPKFIKADGSFVGGGFEDVATSVGIGGSAGGSSTVDGQGNPTENSQCYITMISGLDFTMPTAGSVTSSRFHTLTASDFRDNHAVIACPQGASVALANEIQAGNTIMWTYPDSDPYLFHVPNRNGVVVPFPMQRVISEVSTNVVTNNGVEHVMVKWTVNYNATGAGSQGVLTAVVAAQSSTFYTAFGAGVDYSPMWFNMGIQFRLQGTTAVMVEQQLWLTHRLQV